ncbi:MAG: DUF6285 domain-containing protein [Acidimicrobiales bacterium]
MQNEPSAADLLSVVAETLRNDVVPALTGATQHHARVAASLVSIVERELRIGVGSNEAELVTVREMLRAMSVDDVPVDLASARATLSQVLRSRTLDDPATQELIWNGLLEGVIADLEIAKPGYADWSED